MSEKTEPTRIKQLEIEELSLVDTTGKPRAVLGMKGGHPGLALYDRNGQRRILLTFAVGMSDDPPVLTMYDHAGTLRMVLGVHEKAREGKALSPGPSLTFSGAAGEDRAQLDSGRLIFLSESGQVEFSPPSNQSE